MGRGSSKIGGGGGAGGSAVQQASASGLAKAFFRVSYDFQNHTYANGKTVPEYRGVKLTLAGVNPY